MKEEWKPGDQTVYVRQVPAACRRAVGPGRRRDHQGRPGRMGGDVRSADHDERAAEGRDRHPVELPQRRSLLSKVAEGHRSQRQAGQRLAQWDKPGHLPLQPALQAVRQRQDPPGQYSYAFNQKDFLDAAIGDPKYYKTCKAMFMCDTPFAKSFGAPRTVRTPTSPKPRSS